MIFSSPVQSTGRAIVLTLASAFALALHTSGRPINRVHRALLVFELPI